MSCSPRTRTSCSAAGGSPTSMAKGCDDGIAIPGRPAWLSGAGYTRAAAWLPSLVVSTAVTQRPTAPDGRSGVAELVGELAFVQLVAETSQRGPQEPWDVDLAQIGRASGRERVGQ